MRCLARTSGNRTLPRRHPLDVTIYIWSRMVMTPELYGVPLRSNPELFALGTAKTFKADYLNQARNMNAPEVWGIEVRFTGTVGAITGGALGRDAAKLFDTIKFRDDDDVYNVSGAGTRVIEQMEYGFKQVDPTDIASGSTNATYVYSLYVPFAPWRSRRAKDFAIPIANFLDGGEFTIQFASALPTGWNTAQADWTVQLFADVRDGRRKEAKSRRRIKEEATPAQEFDYQVNGYLRSLILTSKLTTTGYTALTGFTTFNSRSLKWPAAFQSRTLLNMYRREATALGTNDEFVLAAPGAIALLAPRDDQKIGCMPDLKTVHIDLLQAVPASGRMITDTLIDRNPTRVASLFNYKGTGALGNAVKSIGKVRGQRDNYPISAFNADLARKLPYVIDGNS